MLTEIIDIPKTFNSVYGVGPGVQLDQEILIYMKSQGWPERVQVVLLIVDFNYFYINNTIYVRLPYLWEILWSVSRVNI